MAKRIEKPLSAKDKEKLRVLRGLAKEAFDDIDNGNFVIVEPRKLDEFMDKIDAKVRRRVDRSSK
jgi:hypothetical protein